jgi:ElaB/YqjD/DUF883 family membrane-anchored ribosome-binding protein
LEQVKAGVSAKKDADKLRDEASKLNKQWRDHPVRKRTDKAEEAYSRFESSLKNAPRGGFTDINIIYSFIKALDPDSVVRPGEVDLSQSALPGLQAIADRVKGFIGKTGSVLPDDRIPEIRAQMEALIKGQRERKGEVDNEFRSTAEAYGIDPGLVVIEPKSSKPSSAQPARDLTKGLKF